MEFLHQRLLPVGRMLFLSGLKHRDAALTPLQVSVTYCRDNKTLHFPSQSAATRKKKCPRKKVRTKKFAYTAAETGCVLSTFFFGAIVVVCPGSVHIERFSFFHSMSVVFYIFSQENKKKNTAVKVKMLAINWPAEEQNAKGMLEAKTAGVKNLLN